MAKRPSKAPAPAARDVDAEQRILDAAHLVFVRDGTAGARMQEIAREAGVNHALLHYYFRSKERLAEAVFRRVAGQLFPPMLALLASDAAIEEKVERVVALELDALTRAPFVPGYVIGELAHHPERAGQLLTLAAGVPPAALREQLFGTLGRQIDARVRAGTMRPIAPEQFVVNLMALCIFPFAARSMLTTILGLDDAGFARLTQRRRRELPAFFLAALRP